MQSTSDSAQAVNPALITEEQAMAFISVQNTVVTDAVKLLGLGPFALGPDVWVRNTYFNVSAHLKNDYEHVFGTGSTVSLALDAFVKNYGLRMHAINAEVAK